MKKVRLLFTLVLFSQWVYGQSVVSKWTNGEELASEQQERKTPRMYDSSAKLSYDVKNNLELLYLEYQFPDRESQMKFMAGGFELKIQSKVKPKTNASIVFPVLSKPALTEMKESKQRDNLFDPKQEYLSITTSVFTSGFQISKGTIERADLTDKDFTFQFYGNDQKVHLIVQIPLVEIYGDGYSYDDASASALKIETRIKGLENPSSPSGVMSRGSGPGGRSGSGPGGAGGPRGGGSGRPSGSPAGAQSMSADKTLKMKVTLSEPN
ncbi:MAG: hypothetical protein ABJH98_12995 [Reichenbachiella sp.]|uniref:hypothetical protein n=1 Tax=Reichenbachiella sp. TaxID=2184521 RepID=UPI003297832B